MRLIVEGLTVFAKTTPSYMFERVLVTPRSLAVSFSCIVNKVT